MRLYGVVRFATSPPQKLNYINECIGHTSFSLSSPCVAVVVVTVVYIVYTSHTHLIAFNKYANHPDDDGAHERAPDRCGLLRMQQTHFGTDGHANYANAQMFVVVSSRGCCGWMLGKIE